MDKNAVDMETPFDKLTSSQDLRMMKLMIPYIAPHSQRFLAIYIRFLELQNTIHFFQTFNKGLHSQNFTNTEASPMEMFQEIAPYISSEFSEMFEQMSDMMNMMEMMQSMQGDEPVPENPNGGGMEYERMDE